jgi:non-heme chloroperoxidase
MIRMRFAAVALLSLLAVARCRATDPWKDESPHRVLSVKVDSGVALEVLDWGGTGRSVILIAGGGNTAHIFDDFGPKLTGSFHVYGITRRGFGRSGFVATDDPAVRLGQDVLEIIQALGLNRPILIGHSIGGTELSSVADLDSRQVAGLIYLEAAYSYAFDNGKGSSILAMQSLQPPQPPAPGDSDLATFRSFQQYEERLNGFPFPEAELRQLWDTTPAGTVGGQRSFPGAALFMPLLTSSKHYTRLSVPILAVFANPHGVGVWVDQNPDPAIRAAAKAYSESLESLTSQQVRAFQAGVPGARVLTIAGAHHYVFLSNEKEVLEAIRSFAGTLR